jgi:hypothetical protein
MPVRDEGSEVTIVYTGQDGSSFQPELIKTEWKRTLVVIPKESERGTKIGPFEVAYRRYSEVYQNGQSLLSTEWLTKGEYVMMLLKKEQ